MTERCTTFNPHRFKPNICCDCFEDEQHHPTRVTSNEHPSSAVQVPVYHETTDNKDQSKPNDEAPNPQSTSTQTILARNKYNVSCHNTEGIHFEQFLNSSSHKEHHNSNTSLSQVDTSENIVPNRTNEQDIVPPSAILSTKILPQCIYGLSCYRTNPNHFERFSHPRGHQREEKSSGISIVDNPFFNNDSSSPMKSTSSPDSKRVRRLEKKLDKYKESELYFIKLIENKMESLTVQFGLQAQEVEKMRQDRTKMAMYNQQLEIALQKELDHREQHELERKQILAIHRQVPKYWHPNTLEEAYREYEISAQSEEFDVIKLLMNSTISMHRNRYGTVNGRDPTKFLINRILRIYNSELWHLYCFKKVR
ncbi:unnamed protein product [Rotaria sordida]|uniref:PBZ-type domain-containing protein n=1 Tax=Rotaria sordida TaxID=392033 RepID=A0A816C8U6_9BILA|nr:unnamed protein product [Rotaria sordida]CAF1621172.1 unnamed protein product [Rotaria sordida]